MTQALEILIPAIDKSDLKKEVKQDYKANLRRLHKEGKIIEADYDNWIPAVVLHCAFVWTDGEGGVEYWEKLRRAIL